MHKFSCILYVIYHAWLRRSLIEGAWFIMQGSKMNVWFGRRCKDNHGVRHAWASSKQQVPAFNFFLFFNHCFFACLLMPPVNFSRHYEDASTAEWQARWASGAPTSTTARNSCLFFSLVIIICFTMFSVFVRIVDFLWMHNNNCFYTWYNTYLFLLNCQPPIGMIK
jgi:hypothetical protein